MHLTVPRVAAVIALAAGAALVVPADATGTRRTVPDAGTDAYPGRAYDTATAAQQSAGELTSVTYTIDPDADALTVTARSAALPSPDPGFGHTVTTAATAYTDGGGTHRVRVHARVGGGEGYTVDGSPTCAGQVTSQVRGRNRVVQYTVPTRCLPAGTTRLAGVSTEAVTWLVPNPGRDTVTRDVVGPVDLPLP